MTKFKMDELDAGDGSMFTGDNPNDIFEKDNLLEVGLSTGLATALDGKTIGQFQEIITNVISSGADVNLEMFEFAKETFASYNDTGYENNEANAVITGLEEQLMTAWPSNEVQGLAFKYEGDMGAIEGDAGSPALPAELQPDAPEIVGTGYGGAVTGTDIAMKELGL